METAKSTQFTDARNFYSRLFSAKTVIHKVIPDFTVTSQLNFGLEHCSFLTGWLSRYCITVHMTSFVLPAHCVDRDQQTRIAHLQVVRALASDLASPATAWISYIPYCVTRGYSVDVLRYLSGVYYSITSLACLHGFSNSMKQQSETPNK